MPPAVAEKSIGVGPCRREACGDMLEVAARMAPSQPNEAMARIAPHSPMVNNEILLDPSSVLWDRFKRGLGLAVPETRDRATHHQ